RKNEADKEVLLSIQYKDRDKRKLFSNTLNLIEERVNKNLFDSFNGFSLEDKLLWLKQEYYVALNDFRQVITLKGKHSEYILLSFLVKYLRALRDREVINSTYTSDTDYLLLDTLSAGIDMDKIISVLKKERYEYLWLLEIYYYSYRSVKDLNDVESYSFFRNIY